MLEPFTVSVDKMFNLVQAGASSLTRSSANDIACVVTGFAWP
jgi:hypothetical protein